MMIAGIDPGLSGGMAVLDTLNGSVCASGLPIFRNKSLAWVDGFMLVRWLTAATNGASFVAVVERVSSMPEQGVASSFKFGVGFGSILSALQTMSCELVLVPPTVWKRSHDLLHSEKSQSLVRARQLYPKAYLPTPKYEGQAEAILIADWYRVRESRLL